MTKTSSSTSVVKTTYATRLFGTFAGIEVESGSLWTSKHFTARVVRMGEVIADDLTIVQARRFKQDVPRVRTGEEALLQLRGWDDLEPGDIIETRRV